MRAGTARLLDEALAAGRSPLIRTRMHIHQPLLERVTGLERCGRTMATVDNVQMVDHSCWMHSSALLAPRPWRGRLWLGALTLATSAVSVIGTAGASSGAPVPGSHPARLDMSSKQHKHHTNRKPQKSKSQQSSEHPCLEGDWNVTSITLSTTGLTFTGGAGTTVDIMSNGNALGNFTPGAPLTGSRRLSQVQRHRDRPLRFLSQNHGTLGYVPGLDGHRRGHHHGGRGDQARHVLARAGLVQLHR